MPESMIIQGGHKGGQVIMKPTSTFTGELFLDMISMDSTAPVANVTFTLRARTHWHTHEGGQSSKPSSGSGWICDKGKEARRINARDVIWAIFDTYMPLARRRGGFDHDPLCGRYRRDQVARAGH
ncbi:hypothetical protein BJY01DRAFT_216414 [Aspergillus pseudoustus]|uniref:Plastocyanin-like domain-containing protein n=1 Tax=Aspergillus pseudoustus TaxID=1810923 RepID=A0ABR4JRR7_9EURO